MSMEKTGLYLLLLIGAANSLSDIVTLQKENEVFCITQDLTLATFISPPLIENSTKSLSLLTGEDWSYDNWILAKGSNSLSGPVTDKRWEDFEIVTTNSKTFISENSVSFSLYSPVEVHLFVTKTQEPDFTYSKELKKGWNHISIYLTNNDVYYLLNNKVIKSMNALNPQQITVNTENDIFWKIHDYHFLMSDTVTDGESATLKLPHTKNSCFLLYLSLCEKCVLTIPELNQIYNSTRHSNFLYPWQVYQLDIETGIENLSFDKTVTDDSTLGYWGIDLHKCPAKDIAHKVNTSEAEEHNYLCHVLNHEYRMERLMEQNSVNVESCEDPKCKCIWGYTDSYHNTSELSQKDCRWACNLCNKDRTGGHSTFVTVTINVSGILGTLLGIAAILFMIYNKYIANTNNEVQVEESAPFQLQNLIDQIRQTTLFDSCYKGEEEEEGKEEEEEEEEEKEEEE
jgi:hypothetical protein